MNDRPPEPPSPPPPSGKPGTDASLGAWQADAVAPRRVGRYLVGRRIGSGGMGVVFEASHEQTRQRAALKLLRGAPLSPDAAARFEYESTILGRLSHPSIARVFDAGSFVDPVSRELVPYFAMECIDEARPITEYCEALDIPLVDRLALFIRVCDAVQHGHSRAVIHRDIKPANILVGSDGVPKLIDFGVARAFDEAAPARELVTRAGQIVGTLQYMSPEQVAGDPSNIDIRADVYSLGVLLFELLAGRPPYSLRNLALAEATAVIRDANPARLPPLPLPRRPDIDAIIRRALDKDPAARYPTVRDLARDVSRYLADEQVEARKYSPLAAAATTLRRILRANRPIAHTLVVALAVWIGWYSFGLTLLTRTGSDAAAAFESMVARTAPPPPPDLSQVRLLSCDAGQRSDEAKANGFTMDDPENLRSARPLIGKYAAELAEAGATVIAMDYVFWDDSEWDAATADGLSRAVALGTPIVIGDPHWHPDPDHLLSATLTSSPGVYRGVISQSRPFSEKLDAYSPFASLDLVVYPQAGAGKPSLPLLASILHRPGAFDRASPPSFSFDPAFGHRAVRVGVAKPIRPPRPGQITAPDSTSEILGEVPVAQFRAVGADEELTRSRLDDVAAEYRVSRHPLAAYADITRTPRQFAAMSRDERAEWCKGRVVVIGDAEPLELDFTYDGDGGLVPGCILHVQAVADLLHGPRRAAIGLAWPDIWPWLFAGAIAGVWCTGLGAARSWWWVPPALLTIAGLLFAVSAAIWMWGDTIVNQAPVLFVMLVAAAISIVERGFSGFVRRKAARMSFS